MSFTGTQKTYGIIEIALPEGKTHGAGIWGIPLVRVERCCIKGWFKRHGMRVHDTWFYYLPLCDTGQCIPWPFYGRQMSVTIKSISLWRAQVLGMTELIQACWATWLMHIRSRRIQDTGGQDTQHTGQYNKILMPHAALLALNNSQFAMVWTCLQFLKMSMGIITGGLFSLCFLVFTLATWEPFPWGVIDRVDKRVAVIVRL